MARALKSWRMLCVAALMLPALAAAQPAGAVPPPEVRYAASVVPVSPAQRDIAYVSGSYRCFGGQAIHLWVSVKQGGPDPTAEGSGATVTSWYDTNILPPPAVTCDGAWHAVSVRVGRYPNKARLVGGPAWVQFCLVAPGPGPFGIVASQLLWARVVGV